MPRGRPKEKTKKKEETEVVGLAEAVATTVPEIEEPVVVESIEETSDSKDNKIALLEAKLALLEAAEKKAPTVVAKKKEIYQKIRFRNIYDPGLSLSFTFNGKSFNLPDGVEIELRKEVVDHLNAIQIREGKNIETSPGIFIKEYTYKTRVICEILETYEK